MSMASTAPVGSASACWMTFPPQPQNGSTTRSPRRALHIRTAMCAASRSGVTLNQLSASIRTPLSNFEKSSRRR